MAISLDQQLENLIRDSILLGFDYKKKLVQYLNSNPSLTNKQKLLKTLEDAELKKDEIIKSAIKREGNLAKFKQFVAGKKKGQLQRKEKRSEKEEEKELTNLEKEIETI